MQKFDLRRDPDELRNLAEDPKHAGRVARCLTRLEQMQPVFGDLLTLQVVRPKPAAWEPPGSQ